MSKLTSELLIIYHSRTGGSEQMAQACYKAAYAECEAQLIKARHATPDMMLSAPGYVFVCPENLGALSGEMKEFFDRSYYPLLGKIEGRPYATLICAGSDGENASRQIDRICTGWRLKRIQETLIVNTNAQTQDAILAPKNLTLHQLLPCAELGQSFGLGLQMGIY